MSAAAFIEQRAREDVQVALSTGGQDWVEVATDGIGLAFVVFPEIISALPAANSVFGVLFFGSLVVAGLSSLVSISQVYVAAVEEKLGWSRQRATVAAGGASVIVLEKAAVLGGTTAKSGAVIWI